MISFDISPLFNIRVYLSQLKIDYDHLCNRNTNANFLQKKKKFEHLQLSSISSIILIEAERSQKSFEKFSKRWVRSKWRRKKKRTRRRTVAANTDLCHCARFISVRHSTSHIFEPHRIFPNQSCFPIRVSQTTSQTRSPVFRFPYFWTTIRRVIYSMC